MKWTIPYKDNKPLIHSVCTGLFYLLFCWSLEFGDSTKGSFMVLMIFLPGLTFPLTTSYYQTEKISNADARIIVHLIFSVAIYHGSVWLFSGEGRIKYITVLAGFSGSLLYLILTKYVLQKKISFTQIILTATISGLAFLQYEMYGREGLFMGLAVCLWTIANGQLLNLEHKKELNSNDGSLSSGLS
jgi:hypothetical protein